MRQVVLMIALLMSACSAADPDPSGVCPGGEIRRGFLRDACVMSDGRVYEVVRRAFSDVAACEARPPLASTTRVGSTAPARCLAGTWHWEHTRSNGSSRTTLERGL